MTEIEKIQKAHIVILREISKISNENKIKIIAIFGTLLGAERHGGFIPWDDDVDIAVNQRDFWKLMELLEKKLPSNFEVRHEKNRKNNKGQPGATIWNNSGEYKVAVDIFILGNIKNSIKKDPKSISLIFGLLYIRGNRDTFYRKISSNLLHIIPKKLLINLSKRIIRKKTTTQKTTMTKVIIDDFTNWFLSDPWENPIKFNFEGAEIWKPSNSEEFLTNQYGNWREIPSEKKKEKALHYEQK